jgi:hypothetical protein
MAAIPQEGVVLASRAQLPLYQDTDKCMLQADVLSRSQ